VFLLPFTLVGYEIIKIEIGRGFINKGRTISAEIFPRAQLFIEKSLYNGSNPKPKPAKMMPPSHDYQLIYNLLIPLHNQFHPHNQLRAPKISPSILLHLLNT